MTEPRISLNDRFDLSKSPVLLNGTQALVRLVLSQKARDRAAGLNTAGYVTGYRGSPLGTVDMQMRRASKTLEAADVLFQEGLNEDLAATALWGAQQAELRGEGRFDGVFGLWYGKGPGVDRSGDVLRHANMAGTSRNGGVLMAMGDDHTGESSTVLHQSEGAAIDAGIPVLSPAGVQEILDLGIYGYGLSRYSGLWVGLKTMKDTVEATAVVDGRPDRIALRMPEETLPEGGLNIRLGDTPQAQEARLVEHKISAARSFARANRIDRRSHGAAGARIGIVAAGKNWLDVCHALSLLGIDEAELARMELSVYKIAQVWPLDEVSLQEWAEGLDLLIVVEEKRKLIEGFVTQALYGQPGAPRIEGSRRGERILFPETMALDPVGIAGKLGTIFLEEGCAGHEVQHRLSELTERRSGDNVTDLAARLPYFCSGCPHNTSTKVPDGSRAYAGIGCHFMSQWMDRSTAGFTHMGAEGANWIGEAPFSRRGHVFQNMGDGTYNHSGIQAIRAAAATGVNITYKILFNDAVAMTGGQENEGGLDAYRIARELLAIGVKNIAAVYDPKEDLDLRLFPKAVQLHQRDDLQNVQEKFATLPGVSAIIYVQTCAAEKRRRRKRGTFPDPDRRVFIDTDVCEGCGDCGVQSNCVSILPVETEFGRKRRIDQSSCNKDFSCLQGFCPSFVTLEGAKVRKQPRTLVAAPENATLPLPDIGPIAGTRNIVITGVGGTGVVTIGAVLAQAAQIEGKGAGMIEMAGLAQKGGAVHIHLRIAESPADITAIRVAEGEADTLIGGDLVVSAGTKTLELVRSGRTKGVVNSHEIITGAFTRDTEFALPSDRLALQLEARLGKELTLLDTSGLAEAVLGDAIYSNMILCGAAWQSGAVPIGLEAIKEAIALNGQAVEGNLKAFDLGRWAMLHPEDARTMAEPGEQAVSEPSVDEVVALREHHLELFQDRALAQKFRNRVENFREERLREAVARGYHKVLAYKDEYEVARLLLQTRKKAEAEFSGPFRMTFHLAPPMLSKGSRNGRPVKRSFGSWMALPLRFLASMKGLRGTALDPFGRNPERRLERRLIAEYEADLERLAAGVSPEHLDAAVALAELPLQIRGYGLVKEESAKRAGNRRAELWALLESPPMRSAAE